MEGKKSIIKKRNKFKLKVFFLHLKFIFHLFPPIQKMKAMFDFWKILRMKKKNTKENDFLLFGFIMKNKKKIKYN